MTSFAIWVSLVHREPDIVVLEFTIPIDAQLTRSTGGPIPRREEWIPAFSAEEMLFVVGTFPKGRVIQRDEPLVNNRCFTVVASRGEVLVIIKMTIRSAVMLIRAHMLQQLITHRTPETPRMPSNTHSIDYPTDNRAVTSTTYQPPSLPGRKDLKFTF
jgi:hypothetical protein